MAAEIIPGSGPVTDHPLSETFAAHAITTLSHPSESIDPESQAKACCRRAAEYARQDGSHDLALLYLKSAANLRIAAVVWRQKTRDAALGMRSWNGLRPTDRAEWLQRAGSEEPADAWAAFKSRTP